MHLRAFRSDRSRSSRRESETKKIIRVRGGVAGETRGGGKRGRDRGRLRAARVRFERPSDPIRAAIAHVARDVGVGLGGGGGNVGGREVGRDGRTSCLLFLCSSSLGALSPCPESRRPGATRLLLKCPYTRAIQLR